MYQREYAWGYGEITQLINDIADYAQNNTEKKYYLGTLVVYEKSKAKSKEKGNIYETIDGQQRLTTLWMFFQCIKREWHHDWELVMKEDKDIVMKLEYECRDESTKTLARLAEHGDNLASGQQVDNLFAGYKTIKDKLHALEHGLDDAKTSTKDKRFDKQTFLSYLLNKVELAHVPVPKDTDLNHYFEIMNSRGEQLEKHEVLKAKMMDKLSKDKEDSYLADTFAIVWDACFDSTKYIQMYFEKGIRKKLFGYTYDRVIFTDFKEIQNLLTEGEKGDESGNKSVSISQYIEDMTRDRNKRNSQKKISADNSEEDGAFGKYIPLINFPNFLLQVLRIMVHDDSTYKNCLEGQSDITLDDKVLIGEFERVMNELSKEDNIQFVQEFSVNLLKLRFWMDNYVVHRVKKDGKWDLRTLHNKDDKMTDYSNVLNEISDENCSLACKPNDELVMLQTMFHVSHPAYSRKHWLSGLLHYGYNAIKNKKNYTDTYLEYTQQMAKNFVKYYYLNNGQLSYETIIFNSDSLPEVTNCSNAIKELKYGNIGYLVFNYIDYLYWCVDKHGVRTGKTKFSFTSRTSVEHHAPQNSLSKADNIDDVLNTIGNLCLITSSRNSKLSNHSPEEKRKYYEQKEVSMDSIKHHVMMQEKEWGADQIKAHTEAVNELLNKALFGLKR